ncbi:hypothetical protein H8K90_02775 [Winogradskyella echinorum]|uniref:DUF4348 domain-containing protein n=1 Tax=Winogradskyella echinorum TaxID=538189 RepID=A0ABR6XXR9_9FLAO|nr:hypothetical protein [Winogradskyella echinorum]MBC3845292.1 hypothetical protein [Winogradskyella echinorum]MBC5749640.1 hypothetical protein [Winogradskyella echinorum]
MKIIQFLLILFLLCSCQNGITEDNYKILDLDFAREQIKNFPLAEGKTKTFLDDSEVSLTIENLETSLKSYNNKMKDKSNKIDIDDYRFFIIPMLTDNNEKEILIYSYRFQPQNDWYELRDWFMVFDGGNNYFRTIINLTKKSAGRIKPNGEA